MAPTSAAASGRPADVLREDTAAAARLGQVALDAVVRAHEAVVSHHGVVDGTLGHGSGSEEKVPERELLIEGLPQLLVAGAAAAGAAEPLRTRLDAGPHCPEDAAPGETREEALAALLQRVCESYAPRSYTTGDGGFMAYVPGGGLFASVLGDFVGNALNRYTGAHFAAPALLALEGAVIHWLCRVVGYVNTDDDDDDDDDHDHDHEAAAFPSAPAAAAADASAAAASKGSEAPLPHGVFTTGGSMATLQALVAARDALPDAAKDLTRAVIYAGEHAHHSVAKGARTVGFLGDGQVRSVRSPRSNGFRMDVQHLRQLIAEDRAAGRVPCAVVSTAGTTATGAVDDIDAIADVCEAEGVWHHCDGAYGGLFALAMPDFRRSLARTDSITVDPHKTLFLPYGCGALLVRDRAALMRSARADANYLPSACEKEDEEGIAYWTRHNPMNLCFELTREFRGLKVWLPLQLYGLEPFRDALREKHELAVRAARELAAVRWTPETDVPEGAGDATRQLLASARFVVPALEDASTKVGDGDRDDVPRLSLFPFYLDFEGASAEVSSRVSRRVLDRANRIGRIYITGVELPDRYYMRVCVVVFRTVDDHITQLVHDLTHVVPQVLFEEAEGAPPTPVPVVRRTHNEASGTATSSASARR